MRVGVSTIVMASKVGNPQPLVVSVEDSVRVHSVYVELGELAKVLTLAYQVRSI